MITKLVAPRRNAASTEVMNVINDFKSLASISFDNSEENRSANYLIVSKISDFGLNSIEINENDRSVDQNIYEVLQEI